QVVLTGMRGVNFARRGVLTWALVVGEDTDDGPTLGDAWDVSGRTLVTIVYRTGDETRFATSRVMSARKLRTDPVQPVLYDPRHPARTTLVKLLPSGLTIDAEGTVRPSPLAVRLGLLPVWISFTSIAGAAGLYFYFKHSAGT